MSELKRTVYFIGVGSIAETLSGVVSNKIVALSLGPSGTGLMGQVNNFYGIGVTLAELGLLIGITRFIAEAKEKNDNHLIESIITTSFIFSSLLALLITVFSAVFAKQISRWFLGSASYYSLIWIASPGLIFSSLYRKCDSVFQGLRDARLITQTRIAIALIMPFITFGCVKLMGLDGAVVTTLLRQILAGGMIFYLLLHSLSQNALTFTLKNFDWGILHNLLKIGISTMVVNLLISLSSTQVRSQIVNLFGLDGAGHYQAAWGLIYMITSLTLSTLSYYTFPKVTSSKNDADRAYVINESIAFGVAIMTAGSLALIVPRELIVKIFFRSDFASAESLLPLFGLGAIFYISWWIIGTPLISKGRLAPLVILNAIPSGLFVLFTFILLPKFGILGVGIAYTMANAITLLINIFDEYKSINLKLSLENVILLFISLLVILLQVFIHRSNAWNIVIRVGLACGWSVGMLLLTKKYFSLNSMAQTLLGKFKIPKGNR